MGFSQKAKAILTAKQSTRMLHNHISLTWNVNNSWHFLVRKNLLKYVRMTKDGASQTMSGVIYNNYYLLDVSYPVRS